MSDVAPFGTSNEVPKPAPEPTAWDKVELLRRLFAIIERSNVTAVARKIGVAKASVYRAMWRERLPSYEFLTKLYRAYPAEFKELAILVEDE